MQPPLGDEALADRPYVTLILRLMLDQGGQLVQGEIVDTTDTRVGRFFGADGLNKAVEIWLAGREQVKHHGHDG